MAKNIILTLGLLILGLCLQVILIGTSPRIASNELINQFYVLCKSLIIQYIILLMIQFVVLKFGFRVKTRELFIYTIFFTLFYYISFVYFFYNYIQDCIE